MRVPLLLNVPCAGVQPVVTGVPLPRGWLTSDSPVSLRDANDALVPVQTQPLAHWGDGSVQWLLVEFLIGPEVAGQQRWHLVRETSAIRLLECGDLSPLWFLFFIQSGDKSPHSKKVPLSADRCTVVDCGCVRRSWRLNTTIDDLKVCVRTDTFADSRLGRLRLTLHNPRRAEHAGGLWDLGGPGSVFFLSFGLEITVDSTARCAPLEATHHATGPHPPALVQAGNVTVAVPEFWEQFPSKISVNDNVLSVALLADTGRPHELQGGEQKTRTVWLWYEEPGDELPLQWVHNPATVQVDPDWVQASGVLPYFAPVPFVQAAIEGENNLFARRAVGGEYGWRNFGEVYADHENAYFQGHKPIVSHYNNQYDMVLGFLQQFLMTGDSRWWQLADPLARHVIDIDIYHTAADRAAYSGGPFWHTDHYKDAATATHRAYSKANATPGKPYGGGPSNEHAYTTGLLHYYYLTGDALAADAVRAVADWIVAMDDGRQTLLGILDDGPTGLASQTRAPDYHGPGRGAGNAVQTLLNGYLLTREQRYLDKAEELIRRCIHPLDDVPARDLLNLEDRWSYTVFLSMLVRYLDLKRDWGQLDALYDYARRSLLHYAQWMRDHEVPYLDQRDKLEFPTETWAAQDLRKANVLRFAALLGDTFDEKMWQRGDAIAARAWADLQTFETRFCARPLALALSEGPRDAWLRAAQWQQRQHAPPANIPPPVPFVPQRQRIKRAVKSPLAVVRALGRLLNVRRWPHYWKLWRCGGW